LIFVVSAQAQDSTATPVQTSADDQQPFWSPDGQQIVFQSTRAGNQDIYVMDADGQNLHALTHDLVDETQPVWSPDGEQIAYHQASTEVYSINVMDANGSNQHTVANGTTPQWSPDSQQILYYASADGVTNLYTVNPDGQNRTLVSRSEEPYFGNWSPDGTWINYFAYEDHQPLSLYATTRVNGSPRNVLENYWLKSPRCCVLEWIWSPVSGHINFAFPDDGTIYDVDGRSGEIRPLVYAGGTVAAMAWMPDGKRLIFSLSSTVYADYQGSLGGRNGYFIFDVETGHVTQLPINDDAQRFHLSPDGERFFVNLPDEFRVYQLDGSSKSISLPYWNSFGIQWSPDSRHIVGSFCTENDADIDVMDTDTATIKNLTVDDAFTGTISQPTHCNQFG
jgi:Tol biopolymer transport system component